MNTVCRYLFYLTFPLATLAVVTNVRAQSITSDGTLSTQVQSNDNLNYDITQGNRQGNNLFHSFKDFGVPDNGSARFLNQADIANIFSRVTGGNISEINGLLQSQGTANLFLINPSGIVFGPNASLNIGGSFFGSTASGILFNDGVEFSATDTQPSPLLSVNIPIGLRFRDNPGSITNRSIAQNVNGNTVGLQLLSGKTLALVGGDVNFDNGIVTAPGAKVEIGGLSTEGTVGINDDLSLSFPEGVTRGDVSLINGGIINVTAGDGGFLTVNARNLEVREGSLLFAGIGSGLGTPQAQAGDIIINATDNVLFDNSFVVNNVNSNGVGNAGNVSVNASSLQLLNGAVVITSNAGTGNAGNITIKAEDAVSLANNSFIFSNIGNSQGVSAIGDVGNIQIEGRTISVTDSSQIQAGFFSNTQGNPGTVSIKAKESISFSGRNSGIFADVFSNARGNGSDVDISAQSFSLTDGAVVVTRNQGTGNGGDISIMTESFSLSDGAIVFTSNEGTGNAGNITVKALDTVSLANNSFILSNIGNPQGVSAVGDVGNIQIEGRTISVTDSSQIQAGFFSNTQGNPGTVSIKAKESISFSGRGSGIFANVLSNSTGNGSDVEISAQSFSLNDGAVVTTTNLGTGDGGDININVGSLLVLGTKTPGTNSRIAANTGGTGDAGDLTIETKKLVIKSSQVSASTFGIGNAGNLTVKASESVDIIGKVFAENTDNPTQPIRNPAGLFSQVNIQREVPNEGSKGGNLTVETPRLSVGNGGKIQVAVFGKGDAGNLVIRADDIDVYDTPGEADFFQGGIFAGFQVDEDETTVPPSGDFGGTVTIETERLRVRDGGAITVLTEGDGNAGTLQINAKDSIEVYGEVNTATTNRVFTSKISAEATPESTGNSGTVKLNTNKLIVRDSGKITAENLGQGKEAGNIDIQVGELLLLRRRGTISTNSAQDTDGGNININTGVLVAFPEEDSDITSNAVRGKGGRIDIKALGIFGIVPRPFPTRFSDITANSEFGLSGTVTINNPEVDPSSGLIELPETVVDAKNQIAQNACRQGVGSELVATGRGGLPPSPTQDLTSSAVRVGLATPVVSNTTNTTASKPKPTPTVKKIVPAQGWVFNSKGQVVLTAYNPNQIGVQRTVRKALCKEK